MHNNHAETPDNKGLNNNNENSLSVFDQSSGKFENELANPSTSEKTAKKSSDSELASKILDNLTMVRDFSKSVMQKTIKSAATLGKSLLPVDPKVIPRTFDNATATIKDFSKTAAVTTVESTTEIARSLLRLKSPESDDSVTSENFIRLSATPTALELQEAYVKILEDVQQGRFTSLKNLNNVRLKTEIINKLNWHSLELAQEINLINILLTDPLEFESFHLRNCYSLTTSQLAGVLRNSEKITTLKLWGADEITHLQKGGGWDYKAWVLRDLHSLEVEHCLMLQAIEIVAPGLKTLHLRDLPKLTNLKGEYKELYDLSITRCPIPMEALKNLLSHIRELRSLVIEDCPGIDYPLLQQLRLKEFEKQKGYDGAVLFMNPQDKTELDLRHLTLSDEFLEKIVTKCNYVTSIDLRHSLNPINLSPYGNKAYTFTAICISLYHCSQLKQLRLYDNKNDKGEILELPIVSMQKIRQTSITIQGLTITVSNISPEDLRGIFNYFRSIFNDPKNPDLNIEFLPRILTANKDGSVSIDCVLYERLLNALMLFSALRPEGMVYLNILDDKDESRSHRVVPTLPIQEIKEIIKKFQVPLKHINLSQIEMSTEEKLEWLPLTSQSVKLQTRTYDVVKDDDRPRPKKLLFVRIEKFKISVSADGNQIIIAHKSGIEALVTLDQPHKRPIVALNLFNGQCVSASEDGVLYMWQIPPIKDLEKLKLTNKNGPLNLKIRVTSKCDCDLKDNDKLIAIFPDENNTFVIGLRTGLKRWKVFARELTPYMLEAKSTSITAVIKAEDGGFYFGVARTLQQPDYPLYYWRKQKDPKDLNEPNEPNEPNPKLPACSESIVALVALPHDRLAATTKTHIYILDITLEMCSQIILPVTGKQEIQDLMVLANGQIVVMTNDFKWMILKPGAITLNCDEAAAMSFKVKDQISKFWAVPKAARELGKMEAKEITQKYFGKLLAKTTTLARNDEEVEFLTKVQDWGRSKTQKPGSLPELSSSDSSESPPSAEPSSLRSSVG